MRPELLGLSFADLTALVGGPGRARNVFRILQVGGDPFADPTISAAVKARLTENVAHTLPSFEPARAAEDGTQKLRVRFADGREAETVLIPEPGRTTLCVSSQVGCARGCGFCHTATMGLLRNLTAAEILGQVHGALARVQKEGRAPLRNVVFMGMGEPLDNLENVAAALNVLVDNRGFGLGPRHVTVSTVGPSVEKILAAGELPAQLAWSLHAAEDRLRSQIIASHRTSVLALRDAFARICGRRTLFVEITLIADINDQTAHAEAVLRLFDGFPSALRFNLLPMNPIGNALGPSAPERIQNFAAVLRSAGHFTTVREARGQTTHAACGQLVVPQARRVARPQGPS